ncbi:MAG: ABC transporter ATP-binding protein [Vicingaceae bacterium]
MKKGGKISFKSIIIEHKNVLFLGILLLMLNKASSLAIPTSTKYIIDNVISKNDYSLLYTITLYLVLAVVIQFLSQHILLHVVSIKAQKYIAALRSQVFERITYYPLSFFNSNDSGHLSARFMIDFDSLKAILGVGFVQLAGSIISSLLAIILMLKISVQLSCLIFIPLFIFSSLLIILYKNQRPKFKHKKKVRAEVTSSLIQAFQNIKIIKAYNSIEFISKIQKNNFYSLFEAIKKTLKSINLMFSLGFLFMSITGLVLMYFGSQMVMEQLLTVGDFVSFSLFLGYFIAPIVQISRIGSQLVDAKTSIEKINELISIETETFDEKNSKHINTNQPLTISFKNVNFSYNHSPVLKDFNLTLTSNNIIALVGKSGVGKSTVINLLLRFITTQSGGIFINNNPINEFNLKEYRSIFGVIFQNPFIFKGTLRENLLIAKPNATDEEITEALKKANAYEFVTKLENQLNFILNENGDNLSSGQKQRIAIARVFLADPKILILDEATSNLDIENQHYLIESLKLLIKNRTVLMITHQIELLKHAHLIAFMENGKISETGSNDLLSKPNSKVNQWISNFV